MKKVEKMPDRVSKTPKDLKNTSTTKSPIDLTISPEKILKIRMGNLETAAEILKSVNNVISDMISLQIEKERTRQIEISTNAQVDSAKIELEKTRLAEFTKRLEIQTRHIENMEKIKNKSKQIDKMSDIIDNTIKIVNDLREQFMKKGDSTQLEILHKFSIMLIDLARELSNIK